MSANPNGIDVPTLPLEPQVSSACRQSPKRSPSVGNCFKASSTSSCTQVSITSTACPASEGAMRGIRVSRMADSDIDARRRLAGDHRDPTGSRRKRAIRTLAVLGSVIVLPASTAGPGRPP